MVSILKCSNFGWFGTPKKILRTPNGAFWRRPDTMRPSFLWSLCRILLGMPDGHAANEKNLRFGAWLLVLFHHISHEITGSPPFCWWTLGSCSFWSLHLRVECPVQYPSTKLFYGCKSLWLWLTSPFCKKNRGLRQSKTLTNQHLHLPKPLGYLRLS